MIDGLVTGILNTLGTLIDAAVAPLQSISIPAFPSTASYTIWHGYAWLDQLIPMGAVVAAVGAYLTISLAALPVKGVLWLLSRLPFGLGGSGS